MEPISGIGPVEGRSRMTINTDAPDAEVRQLKQLRDTLAQRLDRAGDPAIRQNLQKRLSQVENQLREKDTDSYRRQHSRVTEEQA